MINPATLKLTDIGRKVIYNDGHRNPEEGVLSSWSENYVFVRFKGPNGEACRPDEVAFAVGKASA